MAALLLRPVRRVSNIGTSHRKEEEERLHQEPGPAALSLLTRNLLALATARGGLGRGSGSVEVPGVDRDDVVVVAELARLGRESEVGHGRDRGRLVGLEAEDPLALVLVLQLELQVLVLEVRQLELGRHVGVPDAASRAAGELLVLAIRVLVVRGPAVAHHGHDVGEDDAGPVVLVRVEEDAEALESVLVAENGSFPPALLGEPHGESIAVQLVLSVDLELDLDFPVGCCQGHLGPKAAHLRRPVGCETDVPFGK